MRNSTSRPLTITEIYPCILGESTHAGKPCVLVRLTGCNLRCVYCDTEFSFHGGTKRSVAEVIEEVKSHRLASVLITGGEPLLQEGAIELTDRLLRDNHEVIIETGGSIDIEAVPRGAVIILDVKCPGSGESHRMEWSNLDKLRERDEVKFVIRDRSDYDWSRSIIDRYHLIGRASILFAPTFGELDPRDLARWMISDCVGARLQIQIHKYIWEPDARGV